MAGISVNMKWDKRPAKFKQRFAGKNGIEANKEYECDVLGLFQWSDGQDAAPFFICELPNGKCVYVDPEHLQFMDNGEYEETQV